MVADRWSLCGRAMLICTGDQNKEKRERLGIIIVRDEERSREVVQLAIAMGDRQDGDIRC